MKFFLAMVAVVGFLVLGWTEREIQEPPVPPYPDRVILVDTNALPVGTQLFARVTRTYRGEVQKEEREHRFSEGEVGPGVLVGRDTMSLWVRRSHLSGTVMAAD